MFTTQFLIIMLTILGHVWSLFGDEEFHFSARSWEVPPYYMNIVHEGDVIAIDCGTNRPATKLQLQKEVRPEVFVSLYRIQNVANRLIRSEGRFILKVRKRDEGRYKCVAEYGFIRKSLSLGVMLVNKAPRYYKPKIFPSDPVINLRRGENEYLTCEATGSGNPKETYLGWFREIGKYMIKVHSSLVRDEGYFHENLGFDASTLILTNVQKASAGVYACVREYGETRSVSRVRLRVTN